MAVLSSGWVPSKVIKTDFKPKDKIKLVYTSTPWRGLDVLLDAMEIYSQELALQIQNSAVCSRVRATEIIIGKLKKSWDNQEQGGEGEE